MIFEIILASQNLGQFKTALKREKRRGHLLKSAKLFLRYSISKLKITSFDLFWRIFRESMEKSIHQQQIRGFCQKTRFLALYDVIMFPSLCNN